MDFYTSALIGADSTSGFADPLAPSPVLQVFLANLSLNNLAPNAPSLNAMQ